MKKVLSEIVLPEVPTGKTLADDGSFADFSTTAAGLRLARLFGDFADAEIVTASGNVTKTLTVMNSSVPRTLTLLAPKEPVGFVVKNSGAADCTLSSANGIDGGTAYTLASGDAVTLLWLDAPKSWIVI